MSLPYPFDRLRLRVPLAPVVRDYGIWTYEAEPPTDFFTRVALVERTDIREISNDNGTLPRAGKDGH